MTGVPELVRDIATTIAERGGRALVVGGWVRDRLMGRVSKDIDLEVFGIPPEALREILARFGSLNVVGESFTVYKIGDIDMALPRRDSKTGRGHRGFTVEGTPSTRSLASPGSSSSSTRR